MSVKMRWASLIGLAAIMGSVGCGSAPTSVKPKDPANQQPILQPIAPPTGDDLDGKKALEALKQAVPTTTTIGGKSHSWTVQPDGSRDFCHATMSLKRSSIREPFILAAYVTEAKDKRVERTKMVYDGRESIRLKTYFLGFLAVKVTLPYNDSRLIDLYKRTFKDTRIEQMLDVVMHPGAKTKKIGTFELRGERLDLVEIVSPAMWKDVSKEVFGLSQKNGMPIYRDTYNKSGKLFRHFDIEGLRLNPKFPPGEFSVDG